MNQGAQTAYDAIVAFCKSEALTDKELLGFKVHRITWIVPPGKQGKENADKSVLNALYWFALDPNTEHKHDIEIPGYITENEIRRAVYEYGVRTDAMDGMVRRPISPGFLEFIRETDPIPIYNTMKVYRTSKMPDHVATFLLDAGQVVRDGYCNREIGAYVAEADAAQCVGYDKAEVDESRSIDEWFVANGAAIG